MGDFHWLRRESGQGCGGLGAGFTRIPLVICFPKTTGSTKGNPDTSSPHPSASFQSSYKARASTAAEAESSQAGWRPALACAGVHRVVGGPMREFNWRRVCDLGFPV
jgi:hypothetical protein